MRNYKYTVIAGLLGITLFAGCSTWHHGDGDRSAGRVIDDKKITANIQDQLEDETVYKFSDVDVRTYQGVVQLSGFVRTDEQKQRAGQIAQETPGVARVVNSIILKGQGEDMLTPTGRETSRDSNAPKSSRTNKVNSAYTQ